MADNLSSNFAYDDNSSSGTTNGPVSVPGTQPTPSKKPVTTAASSGTKNTTDYTAKRRDNPLSKLSSHTYQISLYIVEPSILNQYFDDFAAGRKFSIGNNGVYIVAQSGGANELENRAITLSGTPGPGPGYDYFIEELKFSQIMPTKDSTNTPTSDMSFEIKIVEPIGFNFVFQLRRASDMISVSDPLLTTDTLPNEYQQKYLLGIRFYGYDRDGQILKSNIIDSDDTLSGLTDEYAIYERFFPIDISTFSFKLDGKTTIYNIEAVPSILNNAYGQKRNTIKKKTTLVGTTVEEALIGKSGQKSNSTVNGLVQMLNDEANELVKNGRRKIPDVYKIEFAKNTNIAESTLVDTSVYDKTLAPMAAISRTNQSTVAQSERAVTIDVNRTQIIIEGGKSITQVIDNIISSSSYVFDVLNQRTDEQIPVDGKPSPTKRELKWYSIIPKTKILGRDSITNDWAYEITYYIQEYWVPYVRTPYSEYLIQYYGSVKKYNYWYTGLNTEILSLSFTYNNLYYNIIPYTTSSDSSAGNGGQGNAVQGVEGAPGYSDPTIAPNRKSLYNQNINAQIYNTTDNNLLQFQVIGDPDFLMTTLATPYLNKSEFDRFYGPGQVIDPMGGQIFVEIVFVSAIDYEDDGLLQLTNPVQFYPTKAKELKETFGIDGIIVEVVQVHTSFSRGQFTQNIEGILLDEHLLLQKSTSIKPQNQREDTEQSYDWKKAPDESAAETARLNRQNQQARINRVNYTYVNPQSSLAQAVQQTLNKPTKIENPSGYQIQNSEVFTNLKKQGVSSPEAYRLAKESLITGKPVIMTPTGPVVNDDATGTPSGNRPINSNRESLDSLNPLNGR